MKSFIATFQLHVHQCGSRMYLLDICEHKIKTEQGKKIVALKKAFF